MRTSITLAIAACGLALSGHPTAQSIFRAGVDAVRVDVSVTRGGHHVPALTAADFELRDNGVLQQIQDVSIGDIPSNILLVLDVSGSIKGAAIEHLKVAAHAVIDALRPIDRLSVLTFASRTEHSVGWSANKTLLHETVDALKPALNTAVYDAMSIAASLRPTVSSGRMLVLLVTDGWDTASWMSPLVVVEQARRTDLVVHVVRVSTGRAPVDPTPEVTRGRRLLFLKQPRTAPAEFLPVIAGETGGELLDADGSERLAAACVRLVDEFRARYLLTYSPTEGPARGWHSITVKLKGRRGDVRARRGYLR